MTVENGCGKSGVTYYNDKVDEEELSPLIQGKKVNSGSKVELKSKCNICELVRLNDS